MEDLIIAFALGGGVGAALEYGLEYLLVHRKGGDALDERDVVPPVDHAAAEPVVRRLPTDDSAAARYRRMKNRRQ